MRIAVAIPCYKVTQHVLGVIAAIGPEVHAIYAVDDACPDHSGNFIQRRIQVRSATKMNPVTGG